MVVNHPSVHDYHGQVFRAYALNSEFVWVAEAEAERLGHLGDLDVYHGAGGESCNLFALLYALYKVMERVFTPNV